MITTKTSELKEKIEKAKSVALIVPGEAGLDGLGGALALKHLFSTSERKLSVVFDADLPEGALELPGSDQVGKDFGIKDLILRFNIGKTPVEKISYSTEGDILSLRVRPKGLSFAVSDFDYSYQGIFFDLIVTFGIKNLEKLTFFKDYKEVFEKTEIINLGEPVEGKAAAHSEESAGTQEKSICQFIFEQLAIWGITPTKEASVCLLAGMRA